jgi:methyl-accepting chemotaxis protein
MRTNRDEEDEVNWTISRRITAGFVIGAILVAVIAAAGLWALGRSVGGYADTVETERTMVLRALDARGSLRNANIAYLRTLLSDDPSNRVSLDAEVASARAAMQMLEAAATGPDAQRWSTSLRLLGEWEAAVREVLAQAAAGERDASLMLRAERVQPLRAQLEELLDAAIDGARADTDRTLASAEDTAAASRLTIILALLGAILTFIITGYLLNRAVATPLRETSSVLATSAAEILASTTQQASGATESLAAVTQTAATVDEVVQTAEQSAERARGVAASAQRAADIGRQGRQAVEVSVAAMDEVQEQVRGIGERIVELADQAQAISEIIATVNDMAEQTNLLALNAAIEAARAGEQGKGFAVVAGEVKSLAEQSKAGTLRVRQILEQVQRATAAAVAVTDQGNAKVTEVTRQVREAGETIRQLADAAATASQSAAQISASAGQQSTGMSQIRQAIGNIQQAAQQNLAATRQAEGAAQELNRLGSQLVYLVEGEAMGGAARWQRSDDDTR